MPADFETPHPSTHVRCPDCRELVRADAKKCKHCGIALVPSAIPASAGVQRAGSAGTGRLGFGLVVVILVVVLGQKSCGSSGSSASMADADESAPVGMTQAPAAPDETAGSREACRQFLLSQMRVPSDTDFGAFHAWTVVVNADGSLSVGARHSRGYHTCIMRKEGGSFRLESISKMR